MDLDCPKCGSENTRSFPMLHVTETRSFDLIDGDVGFGEAAGEYHVGAAAGVSSSILADSVSPPRKPGPTGGTCGCVVGVILSLAITIGVVLIFGHAIKEYVGWLLLASALISILVGVRIARSQYWADDYKSDLRKYFEKQDVWERSYMCLRCGSVFQVEDQVED